MCYTTIKYLQPFYTFTQFPLCDLNLDNNFLFFNLDKYIMILWQIHFAHSDKHTSTFFHIHRTSIVLSQVSSSSWRENIPQQNLRSKGYFTFSRKEGVFEDYLLQFLDYFSLKEEQIFWFSLAHPNEEVGTWINGPHCPSSGLMWATFQFLKEQIQLNW